MDRYFSSIHKELKTAIRHKEEGLIDSIELELLHLQDTVDAYRLRQVGRINHVPDLKG